MNTLYGKYNFLDTFFPFFIVVNQMVSGIPEGVKENVVHQLYISMKVMYWGVGGGWG